MGVFGSDVKDRKMIIIRESLCSDRKTIESDSKTAIDEKVDELLQRNDPQRQHAQESDELFDSYSPKRKPRLENEVLKSSISTYPKSKLKKVSLFSKSSFWNVVGGGNDVGRKKPAGFDKSLADEPAIGEVQG